MQRIRSLIILILLFQFIFYIDPVIAQIWLTSEDIFNEANEYLISNDYNEALSLFQLLERKGEINANINYKIGLCYLNIEGMKQKALPYLKQAVEHISNNYREGDYEEQNAPLKTLLLLGVSHRLINEYDEAIKYFQALKDSVSDADFEYQTILDLHIKRCERAKLMEESPALLKMEKLNSIINNRFTTSNPLVTADENTLVYMNKYKFYDAILLSDKTDGEWSDPDNLNPKIHSDGDYYITGISADGNKLLLYAYDSYNKGNIYITEFIDNKWTKIKPLNDNINTKYNETHASLTCDGKKLYFTSNRPGGYGGLDIYSSVIDKNEDWGPAVNLGHMINSPFNEETPFMDDNILFFSSQSHYNIGGYDIFYSKPDTNSGWSTPMNVGFPLSTTDDDLFFFPLDNGQAGYFAKYNESGKKEIYRCEILKRSDPPRFIIKGTISTPEKQYPVFANITIVNTERNDTIGKLNTNKNGEYGYRLSSGNYKLNISALNYTGTDNIYIPADFPEEELVINYALTEKSDTAGIVTPVAAKTVEEDTIATIKPMDTDTIYAMDILFGFDSYRISARAKSYLNDLLRKLNEYPHITIRINGYTDIIGKEEYNKILSLKRAKNVADYLIVNNLDKNRITTSGFGEEDQQAVNTNPDGTDNPEGRKYNRRVEIKFTNTGDFIIIRTIKNIPQHLKIRK